MRSIMSAGSGKVRINDGKRKTVRRSGKIMPGGVNSPVRAFRAVGMTPRFIARGKGDCIYDADGKEFIDYVMSWGRFYWDMRGKKS